MNICRTSRITTGCWSALACAVLFSCSARSDATHLSGGAQTLEAGETDGGSTPQSHTEETPPPPEVETRIIEIGTLTNSPPPASCLARFPARLPNCSPDDPPGHGIDCDGDGVLDHEVFNCDLQQAQRPSYFGGSFDCEPDDPTLRHWVTPDADGDGAGTGASFCAGPDIPGGYIALKDENFGGFYDCDDEDPAVHPNAVDTWGDGFDTDCLNGDFPRCDLLSSGEDFPLVTRASTGGACAGPDLYLSSIAVCAGPCRNHGSALGFVGNSGEAASLGSITLHFRDSSGRSGSLEVSSEPLAPGGASPLFQVPFDLVTEVELWLESPDCTPGDDRHLLEIPNGDQTCLI